MQGLCGYREGMWGWVRWGRGWGWYCRHRWRGWRLVRGGNVGRWSGCHGGGFLNSASAGTRPSFGCRRRRPRMDIFEIGWGWVRERPPDSSGDGLTLGWRSLRAVWMELTCGGVGQLGYCLPELSICETGHVRCQIRRRRLRRCVGHR